MMRMMMRMMSQHDADFREQECFFFSKISKKKIKIFFFKNRFKKVITFPKRHADNFLEISPIVKTPHAFSSWICLWRFFDKIWEQECFFREQECFFWGSKIKKISDGRKMISICQNVRKRVLVF